MCIHQGSEGKRCVGEALPTQTRGLSLCWVHSAAKENPFRSRELVVTYEPKP